MRTLGSMEIVGLAMELRGKYGEAESVYRQILAWREKVLGSEHPDTLTTSEYSRSFVRIHIHVWWLFQPASRFPI